MHKILPLLLLAAGMAQAGVYKCQVDGKTVYSQTPCAGNAQKIEIKVHEPSAEEQARAKARLEQWGKGLEINELKAKRGAILRNIALLRQRIANINQQMDQELNWLRQKKLRANNNLAGATWEQSISSEMQAVARKYQAQIDTTQRDIDRMLRDADRLDLEIQRLEQEDNHG